MTPRIEFLREKKLIGMRLKMSFAQNRTAELWRSFMPRRAEIGNRQTTDLISMQIFDQSHGHPFSPGAVFEKWAAVEVTSLNEVPEGMESYSLAGGQYAVFVHRGPASAFMETFEYIFDTWLPASGYELDAREHFELLPANYRPDDPDAQEEVWIPIRQEHP